MINFIRAVVIFMDLCLMGIMCKVMNDNEETDTLLHKIVSLIMICVWGADIMLIWQGI